MATEKILNTRIVNKHAELITKDGVKGWDQSTLKLKEGEIALAKVTLTEQHTDGKISEVPAYLVKVGVENKTFNETAWAYAKAADVHAWAKQENLPVKETGSGNAITKIEYGTWTEADKTIYGIIVTKGATFKTKQTAYSESGSTIKTVTKVEQNANGEIAVTYENIAFPEFPELPDENDFGVLTVNKKDGTAIEVDNTNAQNPKVGFKIATTQGDNVTVTQSNDGLKVEVDQTHNHDDEYAELGHKHTSGDITDFSTAVAAVKVTNAANADNTTNATNADNAAKLEGKTTDEIKVAFTGAIADKETGFVTGDAVYDVKLTADDAKSKIDTFLASVTPDGADNIIDTLQEINDYVGEHGEAFATLSNKVTNIENGTTTVPKAADANTVDGLHAQDLKDYADSTVADFADAIEKRNYADESYVNAYVTAALQNIDEDFTNQADVGKTLVALTQTDGKISATFQDIAITKSQITDFSDNDYAKPSDLNNTIISVERRLNTYNIPGASEDGSVAEETDVDYVDTSVCIKTKNGTETSSDTHTLGGGDSIQLSVTSSGGTNTTTTIRVKDKGITTAKIADHAVGAAQIKAEQGYTGADAEVWVFDCGGAE